MPEPLTGKWSSTLCLNEYSLHLSKQWPEDFRQLRHNFFFDVGIRVRASLIREETELIFWTIYKRFFRNRTVRGWWRQTGLLRFCGLDAVLLGTFNGTFDALSCIWQRRWQFKYFTIWLNVGGSLIVIDSCHIDNDSKSNLVEIKWAILSSHCPVGRP